MSYDAEQNDKGSYQSHQSYSATFCLRFSIVQALYTLYAITTHTRVFPWKNRSF